VYAASFGTAIVVLRTSEAPLDLRWATIASLGYGAGALVATVLFRRAASLPARAILAASVFVAVAVIPTALQADARAGSASAPVKSDVLVVEQAAASVLDGGNPYALVHDEGALATWPAWARHHYPYLGGLLVAGVARALAGRAPWTDPLLLSLGLGLAVAVPSTLLSGASAESRLRTLIVLFVLATGAPLVVTSGKEILVLAMLLASLVALQRRHPTLSGVAAGSAVAMHQLAWVVLPLFALMPATTGGRRVAAIAATIAFTVVVPFLLWDPSAFLEDAVLYPLGFGQPTGGLAFTPGGLLARALRGPTWLPILSIGVAAATCAALAIRRGVRTPSDVARWAAILLLVVMIVAPRVRLAYLALPVNLFLWSALLRESASRREASGDVASVGVRRVTRSVRGPEPSAEPAGRVRPRRRGPRSCGARRPRARAGRAPEPPGP
jgi:hypothetical protein